MQKKTLALTEGAVISALYVVLTYLQVLIFPSSVYAAIQFRVSEFLMILCLYRKSAIAGLTVGCLIANIPNGPIDMVFGPIATLLAGIAIYKLSKIRVYKLPVLSTLMPALFNGLIIGFEIAYFFTDGNFTLANFMTSGAFVAIGEVAVLFVLGLPFVFIAEKNHLMEKLLKNY